ncbi:ketopantoate reductase [Desulfomicrobium apsheronum]|uniref:2-dehydropantoate 2-reductase n=1 Tax=Desulfomicrobium apsheronum TaxID=52560 RepID=A0A1I3XZ15_9BACT|nr:2-dehydropantoate 2-reductase [Desulfomicrobium apsheronum]SFK24808.1 ketopantoate reductase [Desulfomicrobium apsheronum]
METLIIGAGAMGGLFATLLAPLVPVTLFTTNTGHAEAINQAGLALNCMDGQVRRTSACALTDPDRYGRRADLILICTKARSTGQAAETANRLLAEDGLVLTLQNGLGNLELIQAAVGVSRAAAGITAQAATLLGPGQIRHAGSGPTVLGAGPGQDKKIAAVAALFNQAGIATTVTEDVAALLWSKLIVNVGINALTALLRVPNGTLAEIPECECLMTKAVDEAVTVARAMGVRLPNDAPLEKVRRVCAMTSGNQSSMLQDILAGRPTEIDVINGAVVREGAKTGIPTPVNQMLTELIRALEVTASWRIN